MTRTKAVIAFRLCGGSSLEQKEAHDEINEAFDKNEKGGLSTLACVRRKFALVGQ